MYPLANRLADYGIHYLAPLWTKDRGIIQERPAVYALVAPKGMQIYDAWIGILLEDGAPGWRRDANNIVLMEPEEVFYIGVTRGSLRSRIHNHRSNSRKGWYPEMEEAQLDKARIHYGTSLIRMAYQQNAPVDVYVRYIDADIVNVDRLPVDRLAGVEAGLIRELDPRGNRQFRPPREG